LFSTHSVNQIVSCVALNPKTCAIPQFCKSAQSAQCGFLDGT
jgi:hypothetical protein